jgi:hypothetical protein
MTNAKFFRPDGILETEQLIPAATDIFYLNSQAVHIPGVGTIPTKSVPCKLVRIDADRTAIYQSP